MGEARQRGCHFVWRQIQQLLGCRASSQADPNFTYCILPFQISSWNRLLTCTSYNKHVLNSRNFHEDGSTGKSSPWVEGKELLKTLHNPSATALCLWDGTLIAVVKYSSWGFHLPLASVSKPCSFPMHYKKVSIAWRAWARVLGSVVRLLPTSPSSCR